MICVKIIIISAKITATSAKNAHSYARFNHFYFIYSGNSIKTTAFSSVDGFTNVMIL